MAAVNTVQASLLLCGVPNAPIFDGQTPSERVAQQIFMNSFDTCLSISIEDVKDAITGFTKLPVVQGRIPFQPGVKRLIIAFVQWTRTELRCGRDPSSIVFPIGNMVQLHQDLKSCLNFEKQADLLAGQAKPRSFTIQTQWMDWEPTFANYLQLIPGITGIPLAYVIRRNAIANPTVLTPIHAHYIANAPLVGDAFNQDTNRVYTLLLTFIQEYPECETIIRTATETNGRVAYQALVTRFEGTGALAIDLVAAESVIENLYYSGEKPPQMDWTKFEKDLKHAYAIVDRRKQRVVYDDEQKLRSLVTKRIKADFLAPTLAVLEIQLAAIPLTLTFQAALDALRSKVTQWKDSSTGAKFARARQQRQISEVNPSNRTKTRTDSTWVTLTNGEVIEYHPSFRFGKKLSLFPQELKDKLFKQRDEYKKKRSGNNRNNNNKGPSKRQIKKARTEIRQLAELVDLTTRTNGDARTANANPMGGRNERHQQRQEQAGASTTDIATKIAELKASLNISPVSTLSIKQTNISSQQRPNWESLPGTIGSNECDTNADCGVAGKNMIPLQFTMRSADVSGFSTELGIMKDVPIVTAATAYTCANTGQTYILVFNEFLWYGTQMDHSLINPNQIRAYGIPLWDNPFDPAHSTQIEVDDSVIIPLRGKGTKLQFDTRVPTRAELNECPYITMTSPLPWDPKNITKGSRLSSVQYDENIQPKVL